jgi:hypothetical protein
VVVHRHSAWYGMAENGMSRDETGYTIAWEGVLGYILADMKRQKFTMRI